ncbi:MAG: porin family protein [Alphaproteobacteria bacterium]|nr:porin family protein [Alphaproteobacteria bacterium]
MKKIIFILPFILCATAANARVDYRVQAPKSYNNFDEETGREKPKTFASENRFYIKADFVTAWWQNANLSIPGTGTGTILRGDTDTSFDVGIGVRWVDWFRTEFEYYRFGANYGIGGGSVDKISIKGDAFMLNAIIDARVNHRFAFLRSQFLVPFVGVGGGVTHNSLSDSTIAAGHTLGKKYTPAVAAIAGVALEFNETFSIDFGYRYFYAFSPKIDEDIFGDRGIVPNGHQFRVGAKINF